MLSPTLVIPSAARNLFFAQGRSQGVATDSAFLSVGLLTRDKP